MTRDLRPLTAAEQMMLDAGEWDPPAPARFGQPVVAGAMLNPGTPPPPQPARPAAPPLPPWSLGATDDEYDPPPPARLRRPEL